MRIMLRITKLTFQLVYADFQSILCIIKRIKILLCKLELLNQLNTQSALIAYSQLFESYVNAQTMNGETKESFMGLFYFWEG